MNGRGTDGEGMGRSGKMGLILTGAFYLLSVLMVRINIRGGAGFDDGAPTLVFAHWQLEDGFREGLDDAIRAYTEQKAGLGLKVRITQSAVPVRGYGQWFITQLISGDPADIVALSGPSRLYQQYFVPLAPYVEQPNPYNAGSPLEGMRWRESYVDGMSGGLDPIYADYFGVGLFFHYTRVYVNMDLLRRATGSGELPHTFDAWMECCRKLRAYGNKSGRPVIPIGTRGMDRSTLATLFRHYFSQLNGNADDIAGRYLTPPAVSDMLEWLADGRLEKDRLLAAVDLVREAGTYFGDGFGATDVDQANYLFTSGHVGFFPEGTWGVGTLVRNAPFEVRVMTLPPVGPENRYYRYFTGETSELGMASNVYFGITRNSPHFDLALDFLRFLSSYRVNQRVMAEYCRWPPIVRNAVYADLPEGFSPREGDGRMAVPSPFCLGRKSYTDMLDSLERIAAEQPTDPGRIFWNDFRTRLPVMAEEADESLADFDRRYLDLEGLRSAADIGLSRICISETAREADINRRAMALDTLISRMAQQRTLANGRGAMERIRLGSE